MSCKLQVLHRWIALLPHMEMWSAQPCLGVKEQRRNLQTCVPFGAWWNSLHWLSLLPRCTVYINRPSSHRQELCLRIWRSSLINQQDASPKHKLTLLFCNLSSMSADGEDRYRCVFLAWSWRGSHRLLTHRKHHCGGFSRIPGVDFCRIPLVVA